MVTARQYGFLWRTLRRDCPDLHCYLDPTVVHFAGFGLPACATLQGKCCPAHFDIPVSAVDPRAVVLWTCCVAGVELVLTCAPPAEGATREPLSQFASTLRLHVAPGRKVVQNTGSPACTWSNKAWCIGWGWGCAWHPLALCPLVVRLVRQMVDSNQEVCFDRGFCVRCGSLGHTSGYCEAQLDWAYSKLWQAYTERRRRWSCLEYMFPDVQLGPLAPELVAQGCTKGMPVPPRPRRVEGESDSPAPRKRRGAEAADSVQSLALPTGPTHSPLRLVIPEPAVVAMSDPVRLMSCVSAWQNLCGYATQELALLGHRLKWSVQPQGSLPFGGFRVYGIRLPAALLNAGPPAPAAAAPSAAHRQASSAESRDPRPKARAFRPRRGGAVAPSSRRSWFFPDLRRDPSPASSRGSQRPSAVRRSPEPQTEEERLRRARVLNKEMARRDLALTAAAEASTTAAGETISPLGALVRLPAVGTWLRAGAATNSCLCCRNLYFRRPRACGPAGRADNPGRAPEHGTSRAAPVGVPTLLRWVRRLLVPPGLLL